MDQLSIVSVCATLFCNELGANKLYRDEIIRKNSEESEGKRVEVVCMIRSIDRAYRCFVFIIRVRINNVLY